MKQVTDRHASLAMTIIRNQHGFTLVELLVTIGIVILLIGGGISGFRQFGLQSQLEDGALVVSDILERASSLALNPESTKVSAINAYGVFIDQNQKTITIAQAMINENSCQSQQVIDSQVINLSLEIITSPNFWCFPIGRDQTVMISGSDELIFKHPKLNRQRSISVNKISRKIEIR